MNFEVVTSAIGKSSWVHEVIAVYKKKINPFYKIDIRFLKTQKNERKNREEAVRESSQKFLAALDPSAFVVCFDERGRSVDSLTFAKKLEKSLESGKRKIQWIIGGPYGVDQGLRDRADWVVCLSPLVLNQEVALTLACEQIYRGLTIIKGIPYHNS